MESLWTSTVCLPSYEALEGDLQTDVLIIGGGLCGILCAYELHKAGIDCALIEAERLCSGVSGCTTAKITAQHGLIYHMLAKTQGFEKAKRYLRIHEQALAQYRQLAKPIPCDFEERDAAVYSLTDRAAIEQECKVLQALGVPSTVEDTLPIPLSIKGAVTMPFQAQFHPLKFVEGILKGLRIYENTRALSFDGQCIRTAHGRITAKAVVVATHFPVFNTHGSYFLKLYQHRSYVLALRNVPAVRGLYVDESNTGLSFRDANGGILLGGGAHRTGKKGGGWHETETFVKEQYPGARILCCWATQDCMSLDGLPYIGRYAKGTSALYVATGFNKWGMTSSMAAATVLCDLVQGKPNDYASLFDPSRSVWHKQLAANIGESLLHILTPTVPRCPHMGCALTWNRMEHTWDCPCHGSRFAKDGTLLDGPSNGKKQF